MSFIVNRPEFYWLIDSQGKWPVTIEYAREGRKEGWLRLIDAYGNSEGYHYVYELV